MAEPSNGCASRVAHAASPSRRHCIRATHTVLPTKQCPLQIFPVALDAAMQRTRSLMPRESRSYYQARSQNLPIESVAHWLGWGLSSLCSATCTDFDLPLRRHHVHQRGSSGGRWNAMGSRIPFLLFFLIFCIFRSNPSLTICSWGRDRRVNLTHCIIFFFAFHQHVCFALMFTSYLWSTSRSCPSILLFRNLFFKKRKYYTVIWAVSVGLLMALYGASVRACNFLLPRTHSGIPRWARRPNSTTAAANGPCGWNPVKS